jgi:hypothetical protein
MTYRVVRDEHVEQQTTAYLQREGHEAVHVEEALNLSADADEIAAHARENGQVVLTNDDFLDEAEFPEIKVLCYPDNEQRAHGLAAMVAELTAYYPTQCALPAVVFLTETYSR